MSGHEIFDRSLLTRRRERASADIANHDFLLRHVADDLSIRMSTMLRDFPIGVILGAHHGVIGDRLSDCANIGQLIETDRCWPLLSQCHGVKLMCCEEILPFADRSLDLVVSGLSLQWVNDLPGTFAQIFRALKADGLFLGTLLGGDTLCELRQAFLLAEEEVEGGSSPHVAPFADIRECGALLQRAGFALPVVDTDKITVTYENPMGLMRDLKGMGATNVLTLRQRKPLKRRVFLRAIEIYQDRFSLENGRITASFEMISMTGWAPDKSQPKPLRPGSAQQKLADALGATEKSAGEKAGPLPLRSK